MSDVALLLPGQGSQHGRMAAGLYRHDKVFTDAMDDVFDAWGAHGAWLRTEWLAQQPATSTDDAAWSQPLLFAVDYALGCLVRSWGVEPKALLGHSVGEMAAAVLAGIFTMADAAELVLDRVRRVAHAPAGGMLAVAATVEEVTPLLGDGVAIGAVNAPKHTVLAGPTAALQATAARLSAEGHTVRPVPSLSAFHSPAILPAIAGAELAFAAVPRNPPGTTVYSGYTADVLRPAQAADPRFWARQPAEPVWFWRALDALLAGGGYLLIEAGPGQGLSSIARRHKAVREKRSKVVAMLPAKPGPPEADRASVAAVHALFLPSR